MKSSTLSLHYRMLRKILFFCVSGRSHPCVLYFCIKIYFWATHIFKRLYFVLICIWIYILLLKSTVLFKNTKFFFHQLIYLGFHKNIITRNSFAIPHIIDLHSLINLPINFIDICNMHHQHSSQINKSFAIITKSNRFWLTSIRQMSSDAVVLKHLKWNNSSFRFIYVYLSEVSIKSLL